MSDIDYGKSFNEWVSISEVYQNCPKCNSEDFEYSNFWQHYKCQRCEFMDWENKGTYPYKRRMIV